MIFVLCKILPNSAYVSKAVLLNADLCLHLKIHWPSLQYLIHLNNCNKQVSDFDNVPILAIIPTLPTESKWYEYQHLYYRKG